MGSKRHSRSSFRLLRREILKMGEINHNQNDSKKCNAGIQYRVSSKSAS